MERTYRSEELPRALTRRMDELFLHGWLLVYTTPVQTADGEERERLVSSGLVPPCSRFAEWYYTEDIERTWRIGSVLEPVSEREEAHEEAVDIQVLSDDEVTVEGVKEALLAMFPRGWCLVFAYTPPEEPTWIGCGLCLRGGFEPSSAMYKWFRDVVKPYCERLLRPREVEGGRDEEMRTARRPDTPASYMEELALPEDVMNQLRTLLVEGFVVLYAMTTTGPSEQVMLLLGGEPKRGLTQEWLERARQLFTAGYIEKRPGEPERERMWYDGGHAAGGLPREVREALDAVVPLGWMVLYPSPLRRDKNERRMWIDYRSPAGGAIEEIAQALLKNKKDA